MKQYDNNLDASEHYHEIEYGEGGVAKAKEIIMKKIGLNEQNADYLVSQSEKFAIWLADSIVKKQVLNLNNQEEQLGRSKTFDKKSTLDFINERNNYIQYTYSSKIREILDWLQHPVTPKQELKTLSFDEALEKSKQWHDELQVLGGDIDFVEPEKNQILKEYPKDSDGVQYYWVFIPSNYCDLESSRMGHCGRTGYGNTLISLRSVKPYGKGHTLSDSHVTIAYGSNGIFYQVKGKKNQKPAEKYQSYIFDLIKEMLTDEELKHKFNEDKTFTGFGTEYGDEEDYGFEDMTKEQLRELYEINPTIFNDVESVLAIYDAGIITDLELQTEYKINESHSIFSSFGNQIKLFDRGIIENKPSTIINVSKDCEDASDLLNIDRDTRDDIVEIVLCGDTNELWDNWGYWYENASDIIDNLNKENEQIVIDEIARITGLDESVVKENGIAYYLDGEDEEFDKDSFDNIQRALADAQESADQNDYYDYLKGEIESSFENYGKVISLNDEGVEIEFDLLDFMDEQDIIDFMENLETDSLDDVFAEALADGTINKPSLNLDNRYSADGSREDFNDAFEINNYARGGGVGMKFYVIDAKDGKILSKGFDTEEEAKVEKFKIFEKTKNFFLTQKEMNIDLKNKDEYADGGGVSAKGSKTKNIKKYVVKGNVYDGGEVLEQTFDNIDEAFDLASEIENGWSDDGTYYLITIYNEKGKKVAEISDDKYFNELTENKLFNKFDLSADTKKTRQIENEKLNGYKFNLKVLIANGGETGIFEKTFDSIFDVMDKMNKYYEEKYYSLINGKDLEYWDEEYSIINASRNFIKGKYGWSFVKENNYWIAKDEYENNHIVKIVNGKPSSNYYITKGALKQIMELEVQKKYSEKPKHNKSLSDMKKIWDKLSKNYKEREDIAFLINLSGGLLSHIVPYKWDDIKKATQIKIMNAYFGQTEEQKQKIINETRKYHEAFVKKHKNLKNMYSNKYYDGGGVDDEDWIEESLINLQDKVNDDNLIVDNSDYTSYTATNGSDEYLVFKTEDNAREVAIERVKEDLTENPQYFNKSWLSEYVDGESFFTDMYNEWNNGYVNDIESEDSDKYANRLIEEMVDNGIISREEAKEEDFDAEYYKNDYAELLTSNQIDEGNGGLDYYISNFGEEEAFKVVLNNNLINVEDASENAIDTDGIAHFISSYDGKQINLSNGHVAYRIN